MKYVTKSRLRFRDRNGKQWQLEPDTVVTFTPGDRVDVDFLRLCGAIEPYNEPKQDGEKHGKHS